MGEEEEEEDARLRCRKHQSGGLTISHCSHAPVEHCTGVCVRIIQPSEEPLHFQASLIMRVVGAKRGRKYGPRLTSPSLGYVGCTCGVARKLQYLDLWGCVVTSRGDGGV